MEMIEWKYFVIPGDTWVQYYKEHFEWKTFLLSLAMDIPIASVDKNNIQWRI